MPTKKAEIDLQLLDIERYIESMVEGLRGLSARKQILLPILSNQEIKEGINKRLSGRPAAHAYHQLVPLLGQDLLREVCRLLIDSARKTASFNNIFRKIENNEKLRRRIRDRFIAIPDKLHESIGAGTDMPIDVLENLRKRWIDDNRIEYERSFDECWERAQNSAVEIREGEQSRRIKAFRDKQFAHLDMNPRSGASSNSDLMNITFKDVITFSDRHVEVAFELARIVNGTQFNQDAFADINAEQGADFWRALANNDTGNSVY